MKQGRRCNIQAVFHTMCGLLKENNVTNILLLLLNSSAASLLCCWHAYLALGTNRQFSNLAQLGPSCSLDRSDLRPWEGLIEGSGRELGPAQTVSGINITHTELRQTKQAMALFSSPGCCRSSWLLDFGKLLSACA
jgi:hypothetical protein